MGRPLEMGLKTALAGVAEIAASVLVVVAFTTLVLLVAGAPPLDTFAVLVKGSLGSWSKLSHVIKVWIPLTLASCGLLFTFKAGLWNIGVEGQVMMGAVATTLAMRMGGPSPLAGMVTALALVAGMAGGALWALCAGFLKTKAGVHEIFAGLGLNFVSQGLVLWLIFGPWKQPGIASMSGTETFDERLWIPSIEALNLSPAALGMAVAAVIVTAYLLSSTRLGLYLRAVGGNEKAAVLFGLKPHAVMTAAMLCAGGLAGLAGAFQVSGVYHRLIPAISSGYGYLALLVVLLAYYNVWAAPVVAFFFACLNTGAIQLPMLLSLDSSLSGVIQGSMVIAALAVHSVSTRSRRSRG